MRGMRVLDGRCAAQGCRDSHVHRFECDWCSYRTSDPRCWAGHVEHCTARKAFERRLGAEAVLAGGDRS